MQTRSGTRLTGLVVAAADVEAFCELLVDVLGGSEVGGERNEGVSRSVAFEPGVVVDVVACASIDPSDELWHDAGEGLHRLRFEVDDPDAVASQLIELGYRRAGSGGVVLHAPPGMGGALELVEQTGASAPAISGGRPAGTEGTIVRQIDHVCAPSVDLRRSFDVFSRVLGGAPVFGGDAPRLGVLTVQVGYEGGMKVESLQPTGPGTAVGTFAERHPGRFHHLTMLTPDVPETVDRLTALGLEAIDTDIVTDPDWHETYLRPSRSARVLIQLGATQLSYTEALDDELMEQIFAGAIDAEKYVMVQR